MTNVPLIKQHTDAYGHFLELIHLRVGNTSAKFLLDTGCSITTINRDFYQTFMPVSHPPSDVVIRLSTMTDTKVHRDWWQRLHLRKNRTKLPQVFAVEAVKLAFGVEARVLPNVIIKDISHFGKCFGINVDGVFGLDAMRLFNVAVFINEGRMQIDG